MSNKNAIRAWKDEEFRLSLSEAERASLPQNPAGLIELSDAELGAVAGGIIHTFLSLLRAMLPNLAMHGVSVPVVIEGS